jgi:Secretion system C-terminal sorting domain
MPFGVLSSSWQEFKGVMNKNAELTWTVFDDPDISGYQVERSDDGAHWEALAFIEKKGSVNNAATYNYTDMQFKGKIEYYRIAKVWPGGGKTFSTTITIQSSESNVIHVGPNPTTNVLHLNSSDNTRYMAQIFDRSGRLMFTTVVGQSKTIAVDQLKRGTYVLKLVSANDQHFTSYAFVKW